MINRCFISFFALFLALILAGCAPYQKKTGGVSARHISSNEATRVLSVRRAVVISSEPVTVDADGSPAGAAVGGVLGGIAGNQMGGGSGKTAMTVAGALLGSMAGSAATEKQIEAYSYIVEYANSHNELSQVVQTGERIADNTPVFIKTLASGRVIMSVDTSQGKSFDKSTGTKYRTKNTQ